MTYQRNTEPLRLHLAPRVNQTRTRWSLTLADQGSAFRRIIAPQKDDVTHDMCAFLEAYDIRTAYPFLLAVMDAGAGEGDWREISQALESYVVRRAICNLGVKNYNRVFLSLARGIRRGGFDATRASLLAQAGESGVWPDDAMFREAWWHKPVYGRLNSQKLVHLYSSLNQTYMSSKAEKLTFAQPPSVEHIMPQNWREHWPLPDHWKGMDLLGLEKTESDQSQVDAARHREKAVHTLGNITILSSALNAAQSNSPWDRKRKEMARHSLLPINHSTLDAPTWSEPDIRRRGEELFKKALTLWPR
jgi:hypothetical protein